MNTSVGCRRFAVSDSQGNLNFSLTVLYPTLAAPAPVAFGPYTLDVAPDAPVAGEHLPIVLLSHGGAGTPLAYRSIALHLAAHGYVVALPEHFGNNRGDNSLEGTFENLVYRPRHARLAIDAVIASEFFAAHVQADDVAVIGHSLGGYTALTLAGGKASWGPDRPIEAQPDPRVRSVVLLAPATGWFGHNDALAEVKVPILLLLAERDRITPQWQAQLVLDLVPHRDQVVVGVIKNAGHFSFLTPFSAAMRTPGFAPAQDPDGFDRERFQEQLKDDIRRYLDKTVKGA